MDDRTWNFTIADVFYRIDLVGVDDAGEVEVNEGEDPNIIRDYFGAQPGCVVSSNRPHKLKISWNIGTPPQRPRTASYDVVAFAMPTHRSNMAARVHSVLLLQGSESPL